MPMHISLPKTKRVHLPEAEDHLSSLGAQLPCHGKISMLHLVVHQVLCRDARVVQHPVHLGAFVPWDLRRTHGHTLAQPDELGFEHQPSSHPPFIHAYGTQQLHRHCQPLACVHPGTTSSQWCATKSKDAPHHNRKKQCRRTQIRTSPQRVALRPTKGALRGH
jgi:hypothetical protein